MKYSFEERLSLKLIIQELEGDPTFPEEALQRLALVDPESTYEKSQSAEALLNHWLIEGELSSYINGKLIEDFPTLSVTEINGDIGRGQDALEQWIKIDQSELKRLVAKKEMACPHFLNDGVYSNKVAYSLEAIEAEKNDRNMQKGVSKAPPPITPVRSTFIPRKVVEPQSKTSEINTIDWDHWRIMGKVLHWQACALSVGANPDSMGRRPRDSFWSDGSYHLDRLPKTSQEIIKKRLKQLEANRHDRTIFTLPMARYSVLHPNEVFLSEVAAWGISIGWNMPPEFVALARGKTVSPSKQLATKSNSQKEQNPWEIRKLEDPPEEQPWYIPARYFARECIKEDATLITKYDLLAKKVSEILEAKKITKRGGKKFLKPATVKKAFSNVGF